MTFSCYLAFLLVLILVLWNDWTSTIILDGRYTQVVGLYHALMFCTFVLSPPLIRTCMMAHFGSRKTYQCTGIYIYKLYR